MSHNEPISKRFAMVHFITWYLFSVFVVALPKHYLTIFAVNGATVAADCRLSKAVSLLTDIGCIRLFETSRDHDWRTRLRDLTLRWYGSFKIFQKRCSKIRLFRKQTD